MTRQRRLISLALAAAILAVGSAAYHHAAAQITAVPGPPLPADSYAAKFLCGTQRAPLPGTVEGPVKPGNYQTAINVHNPNRSAVAFRKKAVLLFRADAPPPVPEQPQPPGLFVQAGLKANWGLEIDCNDIRTVLLDPAVAPPDHIFMKGWVVLEVVSGTPAGPKPLDVVAAYTAHGFTTDAAGLTANSGFALDVVPVEAKRVK